MLTFPVLLFISVLAGFVGAMSGMGGGVVLIPFLTFLGLDIKRAIAVSIVSIIATSCGSAAAYVRDHLTNLKVGMFLEMFTMAGAFVGAHLALTMNPRPLFILFGLVLFACWGALLYRRHEIWRPEENQDKFSRWLELEGAYYDLSTKSVVRYQATRAGVGGVLMFGAGILAGLLGIGAGAVKVLIHDLVMKLPPKVSTTTSNLIIGVTALSGASVYLSRGLVEPNLAAPTILGVLGGSWVGTRTLVRLKNESVRRFFLVVLLVLGAEMIYRGIRGG